MALNTYLTELQTLLHDFSGTLYGSPLNQTALINRARMRVALQSQCIRSIPPSSGFVSGYNITDHGTGYTVCTAVISGPDEPNGVTAVANVILAGGSIVSLGITGGSGYVNIPTITFAGNGTGASAVLQIAVDANSDTPITTLQGQEVYNFTDYNAIIDPNGIGIASIQSLFSVAVSQGTIKPVLRYFPFTDFQAFCRIYNNTQQDYPSIWTQYGQGQNGSVYLFPIPSGTYAMDWDCCCQPIALASDSDPEAIPAPWQEPIPYYAAYLAFQYSQRMDDAAMMKSEYTRLMLEGRAYSTGPEVPDVYEDDD